jgi:hypothetical protein
MIPNGAAIGAGVSKIMTLTHAPSLPLWMPDWQAHRAGPRAFARRSPLRRFVSRPYCPCSRKRPARSPQWPAAARLTARAGAKGYRGDVTSGADVRNLMRNNGDGNWTSLFGPGTVAQQ